MLFKHNFPNLSKFSKKSVSLQKLINFNFSNSKLSEKESNINGDSVRSQGLSNALNYEIKNLEDNYVAPDTSEKEAFLNTNRWVLFEKNDKSWMELRKSIGEFDISVRFASKPPELGREERDETGKK